MALALLGADRATLNIKIKTNQQNQDNHFKNHLNKTLWESNILEFVTPYRQRQYLKIIVL